MASLCNLRKTIGKKQQVECATKMLHAVHTMIIVGAMLDSDFPLETKPWISLTLDCQSSRKEMTTLAAWNCNPWENYCNKDKCNVHKKCFMQCITWYLLGKCLILISIANKSLISIKFLTAYNAWRDTKTLTACNCNLWENYLKKLQMECAWRKIHAVHTIVSGYFKQNFKETLDNLITAEATWDLT